MRDIVVLKTDAAIKEVKLVNNTLKKEVANLNLKFTKISYAIIRDCFNSSS